MFEFIRTHQRLMQFLLLLLIIPSFALVGLGSYTHFSDDGNLVAKVAGQPITQQEWDAAQREQMERFRQMLGAQFDPKMFDTPEAKQSILDSLIAERTMTAEAARNHLTPTQSQIQAVVVANFPDLADPSLSKEERVKRYNSYAGMQGMSIGALESRVAKKLMLQSVNAAIQATAFAPKSVASRLSDLNDQEREVQELSFKSADFASQVKITDDMLKTYYDKNINQFEIPEQAKAEYVVLNNDLLMSQITVTDADIKTYYEQNAKRYSVDEQRRASHILIAVKKGASDADKAAAKAKAEKLLAQIRKNPADFAKLAKENSEDSGSAERGGDLDYFSKGMMVKPFEEATYKLKQGEISDLVQSDFGYHIIRLTDVKPASVKTLDEVKDEIVAEIKKQLAAKKFAELAEIFTNTVYEQADSLKPVADKLKLKIETAANLSRQPEPSVAPSGPYNNAKFLKALFSDDTIKNKHNTEAVEIAPNTLIAGHIIEYKPATKRPFEEVKNIVRERVTQIEATNLAKKAGEAKLAALKARDDATGFGEVKTTSRTKAKDFDDTALVAVMKADVTKLPAYAGVDMPGKGYSVFRISKVSQPTVVDNARRQAEQQQVANALAQQEMMAYIDVLKQKSKVKILKPVSANLMSTDIDSQGNNNTK